MNGTQVFVGSDFTLPVAPGGELDPALYPDDVMAASLATGVRKLPEENEMAVVSALWGNHMPPPPPADDDADPTAAVQVSATPIVPSVAVAPVPAGTVLDHAIAALAPAEPANSPVTETNYGEGHLVIVNSTDRTSNGSNAKPSRSARFGVRPQIKVESLLRHRATRARTLIPTKHDDSNDQGKQS